MKEPCNLCKGEGHTKEFLCNSCKGIGWKEVPTPELQPLIASQKQSRPWKE